MPPSRVPIFAARLLCVVFAVLGGGCLEYHEQLVLKKNRKTGLFEGTALIHLRFTETFAPINTMLPSTVSTSDLERLNEGLPQGVRYRQGGVEKWHGGERYVYLIVDFDDVNKLRQVVPTYQDLLTREMSVPLFDDLVVTDLGDERFLYVRNALDTRKSGHDKPEGGTDAGQPVITQAPGGSTGATTGKAPDPPPPSAPPEKKKGDPWLLALIKSLMKAAGDETVSLHYSTTFPESVRDTNGAEKGKAVTWSFHYPDTASREKVGDRMTALFGKKPPSGGDDSPAAVFRSLVERFHEAIDRGDDEAARQTMTAAAWEGAGRAYAEALRGSKAAVTIEAVEVRGAARGLVLVAQGREGQAQPERFWHEISIDADRYRIVGIAVQAGPAPAPDDKDQGAKSQK